MQAIFLNLITTHNKIYNVGHEDPLEISFDILSDVPSKAGLLTRVSSQTIRLNPEEEIMHSALFELEGFSFDQKDNSSIVCYSLADGLTKTYNLLAKCKNARLYLAGYNHISYDLEILNKHFVSVLHKEPIVWDKDRIIDVMKFAKNVLPNDKIGNYTRANVFAALHSYKEYLELQCNNNFSATERHLYMTIKILDELAKIENLTSLSQIYSCIEQIRKEDRFTFGKYQGALISEVFVKDYSYIKYLLKYNDMQDKYPGVFLTITDLVREADAKILKMMNS